MRYVINLVLRNWKTSLIGSVPLLLKVFAVLGIPVPADLPGALTTVILFVLGLVSRDGNAPPVELKSGRLER